MQPQTCNAMQNVSHEFDDSVIAAQKREELGLD